MAGQGVTEVVGIGNVILAIDIECKLVKFKDARHVLDIRLNIIFQVSLMMRIIQITLVKEDGSSPKGL